MWQTFLLLLLDRAAVGPPTPASGCFSFSGRESGSDWSSIWEVVLGLVSDSGGKPTVLQLKRLLFEIIAITYYNNSAD